MSYILEALKKSDEQRHTGEAPTVSSVHAGYRHSPDESSTRWWVISLSLLCIVMACVLVWQFIVANDFHKAVSGFLNQQSYESSTDVETPNTAGDEFVGGQTETAAPTELSTSASAELKNKPRESVSSTSSQPIRPKAKPVVNRVSEIWEVSRTRQNSLEKLQFSFHVYSTNAKRRTIIINGSRRREGQKVNSDWYLQEITKDGVVLSDDTGAVRLSVVSGW